MGLLGVLPLTARDFEYTYKGQTLTYTVLDETAKTVETKAGEYNEGGTSTGFPIIITLSNYVPGNDVSGDIIIPSTVYDGDEAFTVVSIGDYAFAKGVPGPEYLGCQITTISLPESVTSIGKEAFAQCAMLSSITFPESLASIGDYAFVNSGLTSITLSESLVSIGYGGFASCKSLKSAELPDGLSEIADFLFGGVHSPGISAYSRPSQTYWGICFQQLHFFGRS